MTELPRPCVVDASVAIKLFLPEAHSEIVQRFVREAVSGDKSLLYVPDFFFIECANVLWKRVRRGEYPEETALRDLAYLSEIDLPTTPSSELMERSLQLACLYGITAYDACYAALSEQLDLPLLTADMRLAHLLSKAGLKVVALG